MSEDGFSAGCGVQEGPFTTFGYAWSSAQARVRTNPRPSQCWIILTLSKANCSRINVSGWQLLRRASTLETLCRCATSLSIRTEGRPTSNWQLIEGSIIFARTCLTCISLLRLIPISSVYRPVENLDAWDLPSVVSLARNIIETYHVFFYVVEEVSDSECEAREALWRFHETAERLEMLRLAVPSSAGIEQLTKQYSKRKTRLEASPFFQALPKKQRTNLLNAREISFLRKPRLLTVQVSVGDI